MSEVVVTTQQMYELLLEVKDTVTAIAKDVEVAGQMVSDHEHRIREIEQREDMSRRVTDMEEDVKAIRAELEAMKKKLWAIPSASALIAGAAIILTLITMF